ncbi:MAG: transglutaminase-like domain-containing protein [Raoultibacter sp.]
MRRPACSIDAFFPALRRGLASALLGASLAFFTLSGCNAATLSGNAGADKTGGAPLTRSDLLLASFDQAAATSIPGTAHTSEAFIDTSSIANGYVSAAATSSNRLKFQVLCNDRHYDYDLPTDGTPLVCPLTMGDGVYTFRIMQNTRGNRYVELSSAAPTKEVHLASEFEPYLRPNVFCNYNAESRCVQKANELCATATNQGEALKNISTWVAENIAYDTEKATTVPDGYIPDPDETLESGRGICFDYASLTAAMLRSQGIACKIVTGDVSPDNIYHAWNMVYIDGHWTNKYVTISQNTWTRIDVTFAAGGAMQYIGNGASYAGRYSY